MVKLDALGRNLCKQAFRCDWLARFARVYAAINALLSLYFIRYDEDRSIRLSTDTMDGS